MREGHKSTDRKECCQDSESSVYFNYNRPSEPKVKSVKFEKGSVCKSIGKSAFECCTKLTNIAMPNSVIHIGESAFQNYSGLTSITIPNNITEIGNRAFYMCTNLAEINFNATDMQDYGSEVFCDAGQKEIGVNVKIGKNVTWIPHGLFRDSLAITSVEFEKGSICEVIGMSAFDGCASLTSLVFHNTIPKIESSAFARCPVKTIIYTTKENKKC